MPYRAAPGELWPQDALRGRAELTTAGKGTKLVDFPVFGSAGWLDHGHRKLVKTLYIICIIYK